MQKNKPSNSVFFIIIYSVIIIIGISGCSIVSDCIYLNGNVKAPPKDCGCDSNIVKNGGFSISSVQGNLGLNGFGRSDGWISSTGSPDINKELGCCDSTVIYMWGNKIVGESIQQTNVSIQAGKKYLISFCSKYHTSGIFGGYLVRFRF